MPATSSTRKLVKPYKEFQLFAHPIGQWAKKIKGKQWYLWKWEDHESALQSYLDEIDVDDIQAGRNPRRQGVGRRYGRELCGSMKSGLGCPDTLPSPLNPEGNRTCNS